MGYQLNWIRERHRFKEALWEQGSEAYPALYLRPYDADATAPWHLRMLGETGIARFGYDPDSDTNGQQLNIATRTFPEAEIEMMPPAPAPPLEPNS